jgi:sugar phosphate isomerase/epimerase
MDRRQFLVSSFSAAAVAAAGRADAAAPAALQFGHRQANMVTEPGPGVFDLARQIPGLSGVELQVVFKGTSLWDKETRLGYKRGAEKAGLKLPSLAGVWPQGANLFKPEAEDILRKAIGCAREVKAATILVACFEANCPKMDEKQSFGPVVALLKKVSSEARDAGVTIGMETSLTPAEDRKLIELVDSPNVRVYYDLDNAERYHAGTAVPGIQTLGTACIRQVHLKNDDRLLEQPGRVGWAAAVKSLAKAGYKGWFVFESSHADAQQCIDATKKNIEFVKRNFA